MRLSLNRKTAIIAVILLAVVLNFQIFLYAYPQTFEPQAPGLARDFSAYYMAAWRLFHNPSAVYSAGVQPGDYPIVGEPQSFRYPPSFLILAVPFLAFSYQNALNAFDVVQFLSVLALAFFVYRLVEGKNLFLAAAVAVIVIVDPLLFVPAVSYDAANFLHYRMISLHAQTFSPSYYCGYLLGNAHILQNTFLVGALYFGFAKKPWLSALFFTFGILDPRIALFALPLLLWYNRRALRRFIVGSAVLITVTNLPFFFYHGIGFAVFESNFGGPYNLFEMVLYEWTPVFSIISIAMLEFMPALYNRRGKFRSVFSFLSKKEPVKPIVNEGSSSC